MDIFAQATFICCAMYVPSWACHTMVRWGNSSCRKAFMLWKMKINDFKLYTNALGSDVQKSIIIYGIAHYGLFKFGNSARICDVIVLNSSLVMYREFHFFIIFIKNNISTGVFFCMTWLHQFCIMSERISTIAFLIFYKK